jgi:hypothetical protein
MQEFPAPSELPAAAAAGPPTDALVVADEEDGPPRGGALGVGQPLGADDDRGHEVLGGGAEECGQGENELSTADELDACDGRP